MKSLNCDVTIIGGGPSGATAAIVLARAGLEVLIIERQQFPRFHIGESLLPKNMELFRELGLEEKLRSIPHIDKNGVELTLGHETESSFFSFADCLGPSEPRALNVERAPFDALLLDEAERAGAIVLRGTAVRALQSLKDNDVTLLVGEQRVRAKYVIDASGQSTYVAKHLGTRKLLAGMKKIAHYRHFRNVWRNSGLREGYATIVMMRDGWFWIIPLDETTTSVGLVMDQDLGKQVPLPPDEMLAWGIARCPTMARRMVDAVAQGSCHVSADFSYRCKPYAGEGYFLVGDAAAFLDPVFSTGVCMGMMSATHAAKQLIAILQHDASPAAARRHYVRYVERTSSTLFKFVRSYYRHSFREVILQESGPVDVHRAIISILAGNVFPRLRFSQRWRMWLFRCFCRMQSLAPLAPRREAVGLLSADTRR